MSRQSVGEGNSVPPSWRALAMVWLTVGSSIEAGMAAFSSAASRLRPPAQHGVTGRPWRLIRAVVLDNPGLPEATVIRARSGRGDALHQPPLPLIRPAALHAAGG